jgi:ribonucleotide monophosphatase NagD (HAD superfamily)
VLSSIDGVLLRGSKALPRARKSLAHLQRQNVPFILLTNGGGGQEFERIDELSRVLGVPLDVGMLVQSHTPFARMVNGAEGLRDKCVLVVGGDGPKCRDAAERYIYWFGFVWFILAAFLAKGFTETMGLHNSYGFQIVVTPGDILTAHPDIWPLNKPLLSHYKPFARPLPTPITLNDPSNSLQIFAILIFSDSRNWTLDATIILDLLLSSRGILGTSSRLNNRLDLPNGGFQQDGQPPIYLSNPDLLSGGYRAAVEGVWDAITGGKSAGVMLHRTVIGKPSRETYVFAETQLRLHREAFAMMKSLTLHSDVEREQEKLHRVYMVGDNPESDIRGANEYHSPWGSEWLSVLVRSGMYDGIGEPAWKPRVVVEDVWEAVRWGLEREKVPNEEGE